MGVLTESISNLRIPGDVALALSYPILWYRLYHVGPIGVSLETQILVLITFLARYAYPGSFSLSLYNAIMKGWLLGASVLSVLALMLMLHALKNTQHSIFSFSLLPLVIILLPSLVLAIPIHYAPRPSSPSQTTLTNVSWAFSQYVLVGAMIPQLIVLWKASTGRASASGFFSLFPNESDLESATSSLEMEKIDALHMFGARLSGPFGIDIGMWAYVASVAAFRIFYVHHWIWRYRATRTSDPIALSSALTQLFTFTVFVCALILRRLMWRWRKIAIGAGPGVLDAFPNGSLPSSRVRSQSLRVGDNSISAVLGKRKPGVKRLGAVKLKISGKAKARETDVLETIEETPEEGLALSSRLALERGEFRCAGDIEGRESEVFDCSTTISMNINVRTS